MANFGDLILKWAIQMVVAWIMSNAGVVEIHYHGKHYKCLLQEVDTEGKPVLPANPGNSIVIGQTIQ